MLSVHSMPVFRQYGPNIVPTVQKVPPVDSVVHKVNGTFTESATEQFNNLKHKAQNISKNFNISYDAAVKKLQEQSNGKHLIDIFA